MRIEANESKRPAPRRERSSVAKPIRWLAAAAAFAAYSAVLILVGMLIYRSIQTESLPGGARAALRALPARVLAVAENHLAALRANERFELLHLDIKFKHLETLRAKREEATQLGVLMAEDDDFVPATIRHDGRSVKTRIRLKGDMLDHLAGDKWSFRVKVRNGDQLFGMRRFSIQAPKVRDFQAEPVFLKHLRNEGVLTPGFRFVDVSVNGKDIGVMAIEEHFSKELLESQRRREGVILRFDEDAFWNNLALNGTFGPYGNPHVSVLKPFRASKVAESPALQTDFQTAVGLMRGFLAGELTPDQVFEVELMARFMAVAEVWRTHHPLAWHNIRFYFNPLTARLEPVGFDGNVQANIHEPGLVASHGGFTPLLLEDPAFRSVFIRELARIAGEMADGTIESWARPIEDDLVPRLQEGFEKIERLRFDSLVPRAAKLARIDEEAFELFLPPLGDPDMHFPLPVQVYLCDTCAAPHLEFVNILPVPVVVHSIHWNKRSGAAQDATLPIARSTFPIKLPATPPMQRATSVFVAIESAADLASFSAEAVAQVRGQATPHRLKALPYYDELHGSPLPSSSVEEAMATHDFLRLDPEGSGLFVPAGTWDVTAPLIIPPGLGLTLAPGTELRFPKGGILVSTGPLHFEGTAERPIRLGPSPGSETWGGLVSLRSDTPHVWSHVTIERTSGFSRTGWRLTGGTTLRRADIKISDSRFVGNRSEDALNMIRSTFELDRVDFRDVPSDAVDADFSDGVIRGGQYSQIGGDGIDVSGAVIEVDGARLIDIADKAISVGEASRLTAKNIRAERVGTGAASKDASELTFSDSYVGQASTAGVSVYTKKPVFGPAQATLERVEMQDVAIDVLVQSGNRALVDGVRAEEQPFDTDILY